MEDLDTWRINVRRWARRTGFKPEDRVGKVVESLPVELQAKLRAVEGDLDEEDGLESLLTHLALLRGERPSDEERKSLSEAMFDVSLRKGETLTDFVIRRERQFLKAAKYGVELPDKVRATLLLEGAGLTD